MDENLDPRFVRIVAPAQHIIDPHHRLKVGKQALLRYEIGHFLGDKRRAALAAADMDFITDVTGIVLFHHQANIMQLNGGTVIVMAGDGDFELTRQIGELGMERRPLADDFRNDARVFYLPLNGGGILVGGHITDAIA